MHSPLSQHHPINSRHLIGGLVLMLIGCGVMGGNWPIERVTSVDGDIVLGALFPVHERNASLECGRIQDEGILQLEALLYTIDKINNDSTLLPGIKLGVLALDSCDNTAYALAQSLEFIKGFIARNNKHHERQFSCSDGSRPAYRNGSFDRVVGIIGGQSSAVSIQLANLLRLFKVPQISYQSTSPTLSNKDKFEYFFRTVPSDVNQAHAIMEILKAFRWTYVSVVYSDTDYGNKGYDKLLELAPRYNICFSNPQSIDTDHFNDSAYDTVIQNLMHKTNAKVVVVFSDKLTARQLMAAAFRRNAFRRFVWIGSDAWSGLMSVADGQEDVVEGAISVSPMVKPLGGFESYLRKLRPNTNIRDPWFREYWEEVFRCRMENFPQTPFNIEFSSRWCPNKSVELQDDYRGLHFVRDAGYAFAHALNDMHKIYCQGKPGLCEAMKYIDGALLKSFVERVSFKDESGKMFRFLPSGDAPPRYTIINLQREIISNGTQRFYWRNVGAYSFDEDGAVRLDLNRTIMRFKYFDPNYPRSFCSEPCRVGQAKLKLEGDTCCWLCTNCTQYQYLPDQFHCHDCPMGTLPTQEKKRCEPIPETYMSYMSPWSLGVCCYSLFGMFVVLFVALVFRAHSDTPIIKASGRELSYLLLFGIFLSYALTFIIIAKPTPFTCAITRFALGFTYTLCYAAIVTKTNRIARIFAQQKELNKRIRYTSPKSQLVITAMLVSVQVIISSTWLIYDPPNVAHRFPTREENVLVCHGSDDMTYLVGFFYPTILIGFCTVYAFKTRKCPEGFNEARYLTFTNYTTCVIWLAFLPLFVLSNSTTIRAISLSFLLNLSGSVQLACLFFPKVYIALLKPNKNTRENVMYYPHHNKRIIFYQDVSLSKSTRPISTFDGDESKRTSCETGSFETRPSGEGHSRAIGSNAALVLPFTVIPTQEKPTDEKLDQSSIELPQEDDPNVNDSLIALSKTL